jgi:hypothetical protein
MSLHCTLHLNFAALPLVLCGGATQRDACIAGRSPTVACMWRTMRPQTSCPCAIERHLHLHAWRAPARRQKSTRISAKFSALHQVRITHGPAPAPPPCSLQALPCSAPPRAHPAAQLPLRVPAPAAGPHCQPPSSPDQAACARRAPANGLDPAGLPSHCLARDQPCANNNVQVRARAEQPHSPALPCRRAPRRSPALERRACALCRATSRLPGAHQVRPLRRRPACRRRRRSRTERGPSTGCCTDWRTRCG